MKVKDITDLDLYGLLFVNFPVGMPWSECRESLELLIAEAYDDDYSDTPEDECPEMCISPYWIFRALAVKHHREYERMDEKQRNEIRAWFWKNRKMRKEEKRTMGGIDKPQAV